MAERTGGHLRFENRLMEAIITAPFSGAQMKIVLAIYRLTVGWQRQTVKLTGDELAQLCGYESASGGFREQRKRLLDAGVVDFTADEIGRGATGTYRLALDPSTWGEFAPSVDALVKIWGSRPEHSDDQLPLRIMTVDAGGVDGKVPENRQVTEEKLPQKRQATRLNTGRQHASKEAGNATSTPAAATSSSAGKTVKDRKDNYHRVGRGDAMQLLTAIEALKERGTEGDAKGKTFIRRDRIREQLGDDVEAALKLAGGADRLLKTKPEHKGILIGDFVIALNQIRGGDAHSARAATA